MKISRAWKIMICKILTLSSHIKQRLCSNRGWLESQCEKCRHLKKCHHLRAQRRKARWWSRWAGTTSSLRSKSFVARRVPARRRRPSQHQYHLSQFYLPEQRTKKKTVIFCGNFAGTRWWHMAGESGKSSIFCFAYFVYFNIDYWHCCILHINYWYHSRALVLMVVWLLEILFFLPKMSSIFTRSIISGLLLAAATGWLRSFCRSGRQQL